jgi:hypothetical protein
MIVGLGTGKGFEKKETAAHEPKLRFRRLWAAVLVEAGRLVIENRTPPHTDAKCLAPSQRRLVCPTAASQRASPKYMGEPAGGRGQVKAS